MGRGRQKAKHTKVARELKYFSPDTNYNALERELTSREPGAAFIEPPRADAAFSDPAFTDPKLEEDLEKWPEFSPDSDAETRTA